MCADTSNGHMSVGSETFSCTDAFFCDVIEKLSGQKRCSEGRLS